MPAARLSSPPLDDSAQALFFDGVVAGSGFGGAVMAARLAPHFAQGRLALLERGREFLPDDFPDGTLAGLRNIKSPARPLGLFDFHMQPDLDILCANALGGGSNIYANVALEPDPAVFSSPHNRASAQPAWPSAINSHSLQPYFARVRSMLAVETLHDRCDASALPPDQRTATDYLGRTAAERPPLAKVEVLRQMAAAPAPLAQHTLHFHKVPLAVNLTQVANGTANAFGVVQNKCNLCGNCVTGCRRNAKNTLCCNYLPLARQQGCAIHAQTELLSFGPSHAPGYRYALVVQQRQEGGGVVQRTVHTRLLVLCAGVLGSTRLLLQCQRAHGLGFSPQLGRNVSGNLDLVAFSYDGQTAIHANGLPAGAPTAAPGEEVGPTICAALECRQGGQHRFMLQDGAWPALLVRPLSWLLALGNGQGVLRRRLGLAAPPRLSAMQRSMVWLGIGCDRARGTLQLRTNGQLALRWPDSFDPGFGLIHQTLEAFSNRLGARYVKNPRERLSWLGSKASTPITVHPLGGCCMGCDVRYGVTDDVGRVYRADGKGVHPGLYVADGSLCSSALGANPSLTIAALAERAAEHLVEKDLNTLLGGAHPSSLPTS